MKGEYTIKAKPTGNNSWNEAGDIEVKISLELEKETKVFSGIVTLTGIIKK